MAAVTVAEETPGKAKQRPRTAPRRETQSNVTAVRSIVAPKRWARTYARALVLIDSVIVVIGVVVATLIGSQPYTLPVLDGRLSVSVWVVGAVIAVALLTLLSLTGSRTSRVVGVGSDEYRAVVRSTFAAFASVALVAYLSTTQGLHVILLAGLVMTTFGLLVSRWCARRWLVAQRRKGRMSDRVLLIGSEASVAATARDLQRTPAAGLHVVGSCDPPARLAGDDAVVSGSVHDVMASLEELQADTVLVTSANELSPETVRTLSWQLEPGRHHLIVAPSLTDIGGPRLHTRPVAGLPLVHVETPRYQGGSFYTKRFFDILAAGILILLLSPVLIVVGAVVAATSRGGAFFHQERVGLKGRRFHMLKFRSMYIDAEERLAEIQHHARDRGNEVMFKMQNDPRVTPVGRFLRRYSIDELPQLFNVLAGSMSLVGPRPSLDREVQQYEQSVHRRFLVKPGITGLWQVSGRSDLSWEETVRLDLFYVENWTMTGDLLILLKTAKAVLKSDGAY